MKRNEAGDLVPTIESHEFVRCSNNAISTALLTTSNLPESQIGLII